MDKFLGFMEDDMVDIVRLHYGSMIDKILLEFEMFGCKNFSILLSSGIDFS